MSRPASLLPAARCRSAPAKRLQPLHDGPAEEAPAAKCPRLVDCGPPDCLSAPGSPCSPASPAGGGGATGPSLIASYLLLPLAEREQVSRALSVSSGRELRCKVSPSSAGAHRGARGGGRDGSPPAASDRGEPWKTSVRCSLPGQPLGVSCYFGAPSPKGFRVGGLCYFDTPRTPSQYNMNRKGLGIRSERRSYRALAPLQLPRHCLGSRC